MRTIVFELCAETLEACAAADNGGADRIELCSALREDGVTPSHGLIQQAVRTSRLPVHVLLRPRGGGFQYSADEFQVMREDLLHARLLGAAGFVLGLLRDDGTVDTERTRELVQLAAPLEVTFHRAFDHTPSLPDALEDVIQTGCRRVLTSGGKADLVEGAALVAHLVARAAGRIEIAVGGGLRLKDATWLAKSTGATHFHGSLRRGKSLAVQAARDGHHQVRSADVRAMIERLHGA